MVRNIVCSANGYMDIHISQHWLLPQCCNALGFCFASRLQHFPPWRGTGPSFSIWMHLPFQHLLLCIPFQYLFASVETTIEMGPADRAWRNICLQMKEDGHRSNQIRLMIGIDSKHLHRMVPSWHRHWHFHARESCYSSSNNPVNSWKMFACDPKIGSGLARHAIS